MEEEGWFATSLGRIMPTGTRWLSTPWGGGGLSRPLGNLPASKGGVADTVFCPVWCGHPPTTSFHPWLHA